MGLKEGVSYGAYGSGIKPRFYGSVDASKNGEGIWEETETAGVYRFNKVITEYSNIVFNNGEAIGRPVQKMEDITKKELNVVYKSGKVYLYCPQGNPQDIYDVIEIAEGYSLVVNSSGANMQNIHVQNFCIMYVGVHGIGVSGLTNFETDGCVIGYIGGQDLYLGDKSIGNGIQLWGKVQGANIHDNYVFQCFDAGITHQSNEGMNYEAREDDIKYTNNLVEYCVYSFEAFVAGSAHGDGNYIDSMGSVTIENNIARYAGYGRGFLDRPDKNTSSHLKYRADSHNGTLKINNNIFDRSRKGIYLGNTADKSLMVFTNNTVFQTTKRDFMSVGEVIKVDADVTTFMNKYFCDISGTTVTVLK